MRGSPACQDQPEAGNMSAGSWGVHPDPPDAAGPDRVPAEVERAEPAGASAPVEDETSASVEGGGRSRRRFPSSHWHVADWEGLLCQPPGLLVSAPHPVQPPRTEPDRLEASWAAAATGSGWPAQVPPSGVPAEQSGATSTALAEADEAPSLATSQDPPAPPQDPPHHKEPAPLEKLRQAADLPWAPAPSVASLYLPPAPPPAAAAAIGAQPAAVAPAAEREQPQYRPAVEATAPPQSRSGVSTWSLRRLATVSTALMLLTILCAYLASASQPTLYGAQADVLFEVTGTAQEFERQLATQEVLLGSRGCLPRWQSGSTSRSAS